MVRFLFLAVIVGAVCLNAVQFAGLDRRVEARFKAVHVYGTADVLDIGARSPGSFGHRFGAALAFRKLYPGATLVVGETSPHRHPSFRLAALGLGRVERIERRSFSARRRLQNFDYRPFVKAIGEGGPRGAPFAIAASAPPSGRYIAIRRGKRDVFIDEKLIAARNLEGAGQ